MNMSTTNGQPIDTSSSSFISRPKISQLRSKRSECYNALSNKIYDNNKNNDDYNKICFSRYFSEEEEDVSGKMVKNTFFKRGNKTHLNNFSSGQKIKGMFGNWYG